MGPVTLVVGVGLILVTADLTLVFARLIAREPNAWPLDHSEFRLLPRAHSSE